MASVRVAVRLRPFNAREKSMNSFLCIDMDDSQTVIKHPETKEPKTFNFDFSYWSHDGFHEASDGELVADNSKYATQQKVFDDLGQDVLKSAFDGYNSTLFAYGQTGSGKSFSMVGYGVNKGIVPMVCTEMFRAVEKQGAEGRRYQISCTMLEIYNECIRDLLNPSVNVPGGLKVRSKPGVGVYVENLTPVAVASYTEIEKRMDEGTANRTIGSTKMNATSSRAHTVFGINFTVITTIEGVDQETTAHMNLVDLAGSERADSTGATGDRLKEGCAINASLSALGNVISALADIAMGKKKVFVPYRNSALTRLLQDALGGNSRTIMIAALSPADVNYDETLSTLRYADRAKKIKNNVVKNENPTDKIIRLLKEENTRLMALLSGKGISMPVGGEGGGAASGDMDDMKKKLEEENKSKLEEQMKENERIINEMKKSWEQKLAESQALQTTTAGDTGAVSAKSMQGTNNPHIINLHEDPQLTECLVYVFKKGSTKIGRNNADEKQDVILSGLNILAEHAVVTVSDDQKQVSIEAVNKSKTFVNGDLVATQVELHSGDKIILGNNFVFRYINPNEAMEEKAKNEYKLETAWQVAMDEFSTKQGLRLQQSLGGEMGKLEQEEAAKRKELEEKLAKMEESMRKEREMARAALEQQKNLLMKGGGNLTDNEKAQLASFEESYNNKARNLEEEIAKRREISEKIIQEQMKRKRQTKKIEEKLAQLMPSINEANSMAEELGKAVRFEARLAVKSTSVNLSTLDELRNLKTIDITVRVTSLENGNIWTWSHAKFDSRLYMMRELYQEFMDFGPRNVPKSKDAFWDPPEVISIFPSLQPILFL
jgi:pSer/pThr/pTyr-binding forkhead associated (FHA) protein